MFAKDYHLLNEIYTNKVNEMNLGPHGDNQDVIPTPNNITKITVPERPCTKDKTVNKSEECEGFDTASYDSNSKMSRQLLFRIHKLSAMLHDLLNDKDNVEAWVLSKITNAHDQLESAFGYKDYESALNSSGFLEVDENNEEAIANAINNGSDNILKLLRTTLKKESREVLEKVLLETIILLEKK